MFARIAIGVTCVEPREKIERDRTRKFRGVTKPTLLWVVTAIKLLESGLQDRRVGFTFKRCSFLRFPQHRSDLAALLDNLIVIFLPGGRDFFEHFLEARLTISVFRRKISSAHKRFQIWRQPDAHWPAATAGRCLHEGHVNAINIGPLFPVHLYVHKVAIHDRGHFFVFERFVFHHVAPVTSGITHREKDWFIFMARLGERFLVPRIPIDRIMCVLKKVRRLLVCESVRVLAFFCSPDISG